MFLSFQCPFGTLTGCILCGHFMREINFPPASINVLTGGKKQNKTKHGLNLDFRIWIFKTLLYSQSWTVFLVTSFFVVFSLSFLCVTPSRRNSDSDDEDSGSDRSSTIFSSMQKADHRLDSNCQRRSLLLELATKRARNSWDPHAARRTRGVSDEPRCTCLHEPACLESSLWHLCQLLLPH